MLLFRALCSLKSYLMMWVIDVKSNCSSTVTLASGKEATLMPSARLGYVRRLDSPCADWKAIADGEEPIVGKEMSDELSQP